MRRISFRRRPVARAAAPLIALFASSAVFAQTGAEALSEWRAVEEQRLAAIDDEIADNGPFSPALFDMYFSLATHYREDGDHRSAAEALEQALHIQRVTHGLFSLEQAAVSRELRASSFATGDFERVIQLETQLVRIARENPNDERSAVILADTADQQMDVYGRYLAGELPPQLSITFSNGVDNRPRMDPNRFLGLSNLYAARRNYYEAIDVLVNAGLGTDPRVVEIERKVIQSYFVEATSGGIRPGRREGLFGLGRDSYNRMLLYAVEANDFTVAAEAMIGLADWHLLFQRFGSALDMYAEAHRALVELGVSQQVLDEIFSPEVPIALPAFNPNPLATETDATDEPAAEFLNVRMKLSRYGRSRARFIETTAQEADKHVEKRLRRFITRSRFRPMLVDGEPQHGREVEFRYYLDPEQT